MLRFIYLCDIIWHPQTTCSLKPNDDNDDNGLTVDQLIVYVILEHRPKIKEILQTWKGETENMSKRGQSDYIRKLMQQKMWVSINDESEIRHFSCLHVAAVIGSTSLVKMFLKHKVDINIVTDNNETPLMLSLRYGHLGVVEYLIHNHAHIPLNTLLMAVQSRQIDLVDFVLTHSHLNKYIKFVNQHTKDNNMTPLTMAIINGDHEIFDLLVEKGKADIHATRSGDDKTPLHIAAQTIGSKGAIKIAQTIVEKSMKSEKDMERCDLPDRTGSTPLIHAARHNNFEIVSSLLKINPDINHQNHKGDVWHYALSSDKSSEIVKALTKYCREERKETSESNKPPSVMLTKRWGPRSNCNEATMNYVLQPGLFEQEKDNEGNNCLHLAARDRKLHIIKEIIRVWKSTIDNHGEGLKNVINSRNNAGYTPLHYACQSGSDKIMSILINHGAGVLDTTSKGGELPLHIAASSKYTTTDGIRILVDSMDQIKLNSRDNQGNNALDLACTFGFEEIVWELRDIPVENEDHTGCTPLHEAAKFNDPSVLKKVLEVFEKQKSNLDLNKQNKHGETVLHIASKPGFENEIAYLIENGAKLDILDNDGNTILHRLVNDVAESTDERANQLMNLIRFVFEKSVQWWCQENNHSYQADDVLSTRKNKRNAIMYLTQIVTNNNNLSVIALAFKHGASPFIELVMNMPNVMYFENKEKGYEYFDVTNMIQRTIQSNKCIGKIHTERPYLEMMDDLKCDPERMLSILNIAPIRKIEEMYILICKLTLAVILIFHVVYMFVFSYLGVTIAAQFRNTSEIANVTNTQFLSAYVIMPLEPLFGVILIILYGWRLLKKEEKFKSKTTLKYLVLMAYITLITVWLVMIALRIRKHDQVLSIAIFIGWTGSLNLTKGFKAIHHFYKMLLHIIYNDMLKVFVVYVFVWFGFSSSFRVLLEIASPLVPEYYTPLDTLFTTFNLVFGMEDIFSYEFMSAMHDVNRGTGFIRVFYVVYIMVSTIIIVNLLIAMMNDSYSKILKEKTGTWRIETILLGMSFPLWLQNKIASRKKVFIKRVPSHFDRNQPNAPDGNGMRWYLQLKQVENSKRKKFREEQKPTMMNETQKANQFGIEIENKLTSLESKFDEMTKVLARMSSKSNTSS